MSLEENVAALVRSVDANTEAVQQLCSLLRQAPLSPAQIAANAPKAPPPPPAAAPATGEARRPPGRPPKSPAAAASTQAATPASAPAAANGSASPAAGESPAVTYQQVADVCNALAAKKGRQSVQQVFARLGIPNGPSLATTHVHLLGAAYEEFQAVLAE